MRGLLENHAARRTALPTPADYNEENQRYRSKDYGHFRR